MLQHTPLLGLVWVAYLHWLQPAHFAKPQASQSPGWHSQRQVPPQHSYAGPLVHCVQPAPQLFLSLSVSASHPSDDVLLQSRQAPRQAKPHEAPSQVAVEWAGTGQGVHEAPQVATLLFDAQAPPQS